MRSAIIGRQLEYTYAMPSINETEKSGVDADLNPNHRSLHANFPLMVLYYVVLRVGWIFKTESIIMPAVLDSIGGGGWLRGCLPMLNRFGQSIPPMLASDRVKQLRRKKYALSACSCSMGLCFLALSFVWHFGESRRVSIADGIINALSGLLGETIAVFLASNWLPGVFLLIYGVFFVSVGMHNLSNSLIQGKLIPVTIRGRFLFFGMTIGSTIAVLAAWFILRRWLGEEAGQFVYIFAFTGIAFLMGSGIALFLREEPENFGGEQKPFVEILKGCLATLVIDKNFRRLAIVASLFGMTITLFPHYQALGRGRLELGLTALVPWVIAQSIGAASFSIPLGWIADRFGNRLVLRCLMLLMCVAPIVALLSANYGQFFGPRLYYVVFFLLGLFPVGMRAFNNYTLEIVGARHQPKYLSTLSLCMAAPAILTSWVVGGVVEKAGFEIAFILVVACVFIGWILTFALEEPRKKLAA